MRTSTVKMAALSPSYRSCTSSNLVIPPRVRHSSGVASDCFIRGRSFVFVLVLAPRCAAVDVSASFLT